MISTPNFVHNYKRYYFPFYGAPCCEKMSAWLDIKSFFQFPGLTLAPRALQTDLLIVIGRISHKQAPVLQHFYYDMLVPNAVIHLKGCSTHYAGYATMDKLDRLVPINCQIDKCPVDVATLSQAFEHAQLRKK